MKKLLSATAFALVATQANAGLDYDVTLEPNHQESFYNALPWKTSGNCTVETTEALIAVEITVTSGSGTINGKKVSSGSHKIIKARNGDRFYVSANRFSGIRIVKIQPDDSLPNNENATAHCHL